MKPLSICRKQKPAVDHAQWAWTAPSERGWLENSIGSSSPIRGGRG
jgi:hypothetical protein